MRDKDPQKLQIGRRFREARERKGWTRERLAEEANLSVPFLADFELGYTGIRLDRLMNLCKILQLDANYALFGEGKRRPTVQRILALLDTQEEHDLRRLEAIIQAYVGAS